MAGKKPYRMGPAAAVKKAKPPAPAPAAKKSFKNTLGDAFEDATDYAKRSLADVEDAATAVKNKVTTGRYRMGVDSATGKKWPYGRGYAAERADRHHGYNLLDRKARDAPPAPPAPASKPAPAPKPAPPKRAPVARAASKAKPAKPAPTTIDPWTADQEYSPRGPFSTDKGINTKPPPGQPGSRKVAPSQAVRRGDIATDRLRPLDPGMKGYKLPKMGDKTEALEVTVGGKKKTVRVPKAGKVKL